MTEFLQTHIGLFVEGILVFGGAMAFGFWQLSELKKLRKEREAREQEQQRDASGDTHQS
ncbi:MAG: hypothetical protein AAGE89_05270 [Pseudomonadota bacterium]